MVGDVDRYLYGCASLLVPECHVYLYVCVWNIWQGRSGTKVPRFDIYSSVISLSEIIRQIWHNHPFR